MREFMHVDDLARAVLFSLENWDPKNKNAPKTENGETLFFLNVETGIDITIKDLAHKIANLTNYRGTILWDKSKPDGTPKKQLDVTRLSTLGWRARIPLAEGLKSTVAMFRDQLSLKLVRL